MRNGAGKSTTMRVILGLDAPDAGTALIGGPTASCIPPLCHVGSLSDAAAIQPGLASSGNDNRRVLAAITYLEP
jgi:ABC-type multidrug transport system ATPase subunit